MPFSGLLFCRCFLLVVAPFVLALFSQSAHAAGVTFVSCQGPGTYANGQFAPVAASCPGGTFATIGDAGIAFRAPLVAWANSGDWGSACNGKNTIYQPTYDGQNISVRATLCHSPQGIAVYFDRYYGATVTGGTAPAQAGCPAPGTVGDNIQEGGLSSPDLGTKQFCEPTSASNTQAAGCLIEVKFDMAFGLDRTADGAIIWGRNGSSKYTGATCTPGSGGVGPVSSTPNTGTTTAAPAPCPKGYYYGQVNGVDKCIAPDPGVTVTKSTSGTNTTTTSNPSTGTQTTAITAETTCTGETCTTITSTTIITQAPGGGTSSSTTSSSTSEGKGDFCTKKPKDVACVGGGGDEGTAADSALPGQPSLYEKKYPDGLSGVWAEKKEQLTSSPLLALAGSLMPTIAPTGTCPSWMIDLSFGTVGPVVLDFGQHDFAPPCSIWPLAASIVIVSALLLARALIFGG